MLAARAEVCYRGDLNVDGAVDGNDVSILLEMVLSGGVSDAQLAVADINGDQSVDGNDVSILLEIVLTGSPQVLYEYETFSVNGRQFTMVKLPGGTFEMGSDEGYDNESPTHNVTLSPFMMGQTEVTQGLWNAVMGSNPSSNVGYDLPVEKVSWDDCQVFIGKLNSYLASRLKSEGKVFRLATEAEWEYAARGGISGGTLYAGSNTIGDVAWYTDNAYSTHNVATKLPNEFWLYDMSGNVWEWCQDYYGSYDAADVTDPTGPATGSGRVYRGGGYNSAAASCRVSRRGYNAATLLDGGLGLRLVLADAPTLQEYTVNGVTFTMIRVPAGNFTMGATEEQGSYTFDDEKPTHSVGVSGFWIGQTEVTQELWKAVMGTNPSKYKDDKQPVEMVSWQDCQEFISLLNGLIAGRPELAGKMFRLPTEAEWEYAARGAQSGGTRYAGSDNVDAVAWYKNTTEAVDAYHPMPVATKAPNSLGLYDMSGNVLEWCQDWYGEYPSTAQVNPQGPSSGSDRVARGGGWAEPATYMRVAARAHDQPSLHSGSVGLRLVLVDDPAARVFTVNGVTFTMKAVPGGTFTMGATSEQGDYTFDDEKATHSVTLSSFWMGQTEVTQALWTAVMGSNPSGNVGDNLPVEKVSWEDCQAFVVKLNALTGAHFRLPTEAEWEYAARGAQSGGTKYAGSDDIDKVAWYEVTSKVTRQVATKLPNSLGLYDMSGNVYEWCQDWYGDYPSAAQKNPQGPASGDSRVFRGGSKGVDEFYCRVSCRHRYYAYMSVDYIGLRLVLDEEPTRQTFTVNGTSFTMLRVPAGTFTMGATSEQSDLYFTGEKPAHSVTLSRYSLGETEVTQALWYAVMGNSPSAFYGTQRPVESVSWDECQAFITKLNELTGETFRLPTEAEWEYAARGAQSGGYIYPGSNSVGEVAWYYDNSQETTHVVASKKANALGFYDMGGNVEEWCYDLYPQYSSDALTCPQGASAGTNRVYRGGSYINSNRECRVSYRSSDYPDTKAKWRGFRLAR